MAESSNSSQAIRSTTFGEVMLSQWQRGLFEDGPLWFAKALLLMALASLAVHRLLGWPREGTRPFPTDLQLLLAAIACGLALAGLPFFQSGLGSRGHGGVLHMDHAPHHGGQLLMLGNHHLEIVEKGGEWLARQGIHAQWAAATAAI